MSSMAERFYLIIKRRGLLAKAVKLLYYVTLRPARVAHLWARGQREWSTRMFEKQIRDLREAMGESEL